MKFFSSRWRPGDIVAGKVIRLDPKAAFVDLGEQTEVDLPWQELSIDLEQNLLEVLQVNEVREFLLVNQLDETGNEQLFLSLQQLEEQRSWERLRQMQAENVTVYSQVIATNPNEAFVKIEGLLGSIPRSELLGNQAIEEFIAKVLPLKFYGVDENNNSLILSHKRALLLPKLKQFTVGEVVTGKIQQIKHYGAFVELGDAIALLRLPEISHAHFDTVHQVFKVNDEIKAIIIDLDFERGIISLSTKALELEPGEMVKHPQIAIHLI